MPLPSRLIVTCTLVAAVLMIPPVTAKPDPADAAPGSARTGAVEPTGGPTAALPAGTTAVSGGARTAAARVGSARPRGVLAGKVVVIDPGHQLGNSRHPRQVRRLVDAGGFRKACNTTGTQTNSGYPEATFTFSTARHLKARLEARGARVYLTRTRNSVKAWGPCIDVRGRFAASVHADALVSVHADGTASDRRGFFVIRPADRKGWTRDIYRESRVLSLDVRAGLRGAGLDYADYVGGDGLDTRGDLGTLNWSDVPAVMVELGNMRNRRDAARMRDARWRSGVYAEGLADGLTRFLTR